MADARLIEVGRVAGAFGVRGEVRITAYTEDPLALVRYKRLQRQDGSHGLTILQARAEKGSIVGRAEEIATKEEADALRGLRLYVPREALPEPDEDEFYLADLIGMAVQHIETGAPLGRVKSVQNFGAGDILEIAPEAGGATWYLPFTREAAPEVDVAAGIVRANPPEESD
ncbi:MAG TPA: ribosome maturation factor RimM [Caulobacteraceae bacterium]|nr:ribosome maturation factor RimM [Caulobacteraceae bacterium]